MRVFECSLNYRKRRNEDIRLTAKEKMTLRNLKDEVYA